MFNNFISIVVVNYNGENWINGFLESLLKSNYKNYELVFVDNNSTDNSLFVIDKYKNLIDLNIIRNQKNLGFASGNNLGIKQSKYNFILLINSDVKFDENFLENIISFYDVNNFDIVAPRQSSYDGTFMEVGEHTIDMFGYSCVSNSKSFYLSGCCLFFKKDFYYETAGLDNNFFMYNEEVDWFWRLNLLCKKYKYIDNLFIHHNSAGLGSYIRQNVFLWRNQNTLQMLLKNYSWYNLLWILPIYFIQNILEIIFFLLILKPKIAFSYIEGLWFNIKNIDKILEKRKWIQNNRLISDKEIIKKMYFGSGKFLSLIDFIKKNGNRKK